MFSISHFFVPPYTGGQNLTISCLSLLRPAVRRTRKRSVGGETAGTGPERNDRRRAAGGSTPTIRHCTDAVRDVARFLWNGTGGGVRGKGRPSAGALKHKSALVTAVEIRGQSVEQKEKWKPSNLAKRIRNHRPPACFKTPYDECKQANSN